MDPTEAQSAGDPEEETMARKRARRVSFAETTAVHVFDRDEDSETPPDSRPADDGEDTRTRPVVGFPGEHSDSDDSRGSVREEEEDDDGEEEQERFVKDMDSSSPGSAVGSVTSNDDDNFFGPVSTSFIRTGRFSDSGMSDDNNHDITLDSTAFSLHFHNIVPPDDPSANSVGSLKTPTESFIPVDSGNFMFQTGFKNPIPQGKHSDGKAGGSATDSNYLSLIVKNPNRYEYGNISPTLEALLSEVNKSMQLNSPNIDSRIIAPDHHRDKDIDAEDCSKEERLVENTSAPGDEADDNSVDLCMSNGFSGGNANNQLGDRNPGSIISLPTNAHSNEAKQDSSLVIKSNEDACFEIQVDKTVASTENYNTLTTEDNSPRANTILESDHANPESFREKANGNKNHANYSPKLDHKVPQMATEDGLQQSLEPEHGLQTPKSGIQLFQSPFQGSILSIHAKRQQLFSDPLNGSAKELPPSSIKVELERHSERISAIKNSIPKFKVPETPILIAPSAFSGGADNIEPIDKKKNNIPHQIGDSLEKIHNDPGTNQDGGSVTSTKNYVISGLLGAGHLETSGELNSLRADIFNKPKEIDGAAVRLTDSASSFQSPKSAINMKQNHPASQNLIERFSTPNAHVSILRQTLLEPTENGLGQNLSSQLASSPVFMLKSRLPASREACLTPSTDGTISLAFMLAENKVHPTTSTMKFKNIEKFQDVNTIAENDFPSCDSWNKSSILRDSFVGSRDQNVEMRNASDLLEKSSEKETFAPSVLSSFEGSCLETTTNNSIECCSEVTIQNHTEKANNHTLLSLSSANIMELKEDASLCDGENFKDLYALAEPFSAQDFEIGKKRRIDKLLMDEKQTNETSRAQKKLLNKVVGGNVESNNGLPNVGVLARLENWTDILSKLHDVTKQLFPSSVCKLKAKEIDTLEDVLGKLHMSMKYKKLSTMILSLQRIHDSSGDLHQERVAEAIKLQNMLVFEQAKLQLKHVKLDQLRDKASHFQSGIQGCYKLKSMLMQFYAHDETRPVQSKDGPISSVLCSSNQELNRVTSMKQEAEILDHKVDLLLKSFVASFKVKGNLDCNGIINAVGKNLVSRNHCRAVHKVLQLWELTSIVNQNEQSDIVLNYCNLLSQRFVLKSSPASSIFVNNMLNTTNIEKNYPCMCATAAFEFVFEVKNGCRLAGLKSLKQQISITSFLMGALLEVVQEVHMARMHISNLISSNFLSRNSGQLELQLCFLSFKTGRKVTLSLNMTDLNCGIYPSEPSQLHAKILEAKTTFPATIVDEIMLSLCRLQVGLPLILRLTQHVSQVVQASK